MRLQIYTPGRWAAGTPGDLEAMRQVALPCWAWRMRRRGTRLQAHLVDEPLQVDLLAINRYDEPDRFVARLCRPGQLADWRWEMHGARIERAAADVLLLRGDEWDPAAGQHWDQTWMCTVTLDRGRGILAELATRQAGAD